MRLFFAFSLILGIAVNCSSVNKVEFVQEQDQIAVRINGVQVTTYLFKPDQPKPVLYPVYTLSGVLLTRKFPFEKVEGESADHPHHFGIFFTYDEVNKDGFWNNTVVPPQIKHVKITEMQGGEDKGTLATISHWVGKSGKTLLEEERSMVFYPGAGSYHIDFTFKLTAMDTAVVFGDTKEGMFSIRVADWLAEKSGNSEYLSSNGDRKEKDVWGKRAEWVCLHGSKDGKKVGIAILNQPQSVNYPTFWHARGYGLFAANPLGQGAFEKSRKVENATALHLTLQRGESALFKFRVIIYDGSKDKSALDEAFADYCR